MSNIYSVSDGVRSSRIRLFDMKLCSDGAERMTLDALREVDGDPRDALRQTIRFQSRVLLRSRRQNEDPRFPGDGVPIPQMKN